ncbi:hypothetical protein BDF22DRAFT_695977 [Syncephalis plumigaleata]|nr:hypothetical protein BDF22DRAFT_695977 [Syncephalis plumigaleata]
MERSKVAVLPARPMSSARTLHRRSPLVRASKSEESASIFSSLTDMVSRARANANKEFDELCAYLTKYFDPGQSMYDSQLDVNQLDDRTAVASKQRPVERGVKDEHMWANNTLRTEPLLKDPLRANGRGGIVKRAPLASLASHSNRVNGATMKNGVSDQVRVLRQVLKQSNGKEDIIKSNGNGKVLESSLSHVVFKPRRQSSTPWISNTPTINKQQVLRSVSVQDSNDNTASNGVTSMAAAPSPFIAKNELKRSALQVVSTNIVPLATGNTPKKSMKRPTSQPSRNNDDDVVAPPSLATVFAGATPVPSRMNAPSTARKIIPETECNTQMAGRTPKRLRLFDMPLDGMRTPGNQLDLLSFDTPAEKETQAVEQWLKSTSSEKQVEPDTLASPPPRELPPVRERRITPKRSASTAATNKVNAIMNSYRKVRRSATTDTSTTPNPTSEHIAVPQPKRTAVNRRPDIQTSRMVHPSVATRQSKGNNPRAIQSTRTLSTRATALSSDNVIVKKEEPETPQRYSATTHHHHRYP